VGLDRVRSPDVPDPFVVADLADERQVVHGVAAAARQLGGLDILVNNAGIMREAGLRDTTAADIDRHFSINVRGAILAAREVLKVMGPGGRIVTSPPRWHRERRAPCGRQHLAQ
jgi:3-oxoacyl-[acyl-carrier protein] reductase